MMLAALMLAAVMATGEPDLRLELVRHSLTGTHYRYRQYINDVAVVGGEVNVTVSPGGELREVRSVASTPVTAMRWAGAPLLTQNYINVDGVARLANRVETRDGVLRTVRYFDAESGDLLREEEHFYRAKATRVFDPDPVTRLNDPSLQDRGDADRAVPAAAYSDAEIDGLDIPFVRIVDTQNPAVPPADSTQPLLFLRSESGFEDVNAVFHIDRAQRHLQELGYDGDRAIASYTIDVDTHAASGADDSFFVASPVTGRGSLFFGEGGTDDAEDSDLIVHEYAHAIHEWIAPGTFLGATSSQARAVSEGFGDYWALSASYAAAITSGRDPFCFADWDARCWEDATSERCGYAPGSDCLRRLDSAKSVRDFIDSGNSGSEHLNGEIWSSALREIFVALIARYGVEEGRRISDTIVIESLFGTPPNPSFAAIAARMLAVDRYLNSGASRAEICAAMTQRGILFTCGLPRGESTLFQSAQRGVAIPDNTPGGVILSAFVDDGRLVERVEVSVNIRHPRRGDLRLVLIAPDGAQLTLQNPSFDRAPDIVATYGREVVPPDSLAVLRGRPARGEWRLGVSDNGFRDEGEVLSWSLIIQFAGEQPLDQRPSAEARQFIPAIAHNPGLNGTFFRSDVRLFNRGSRETVTTLVFTPAGAEGRIDFGAVKVVVPAEGVVALDDIVRGLFGTAGSGQLEILGDVRAVARTYTEHDGGTLGHSVPAIDPAAAMRRGDAPQLIPFVENSATFRTNTGFAETSGFAGRVRVRYPGGEETYPITPFGHLQIRASGAGRVFAEASVIEGDAAVIAYASVVDNGSGDAMMIPAERVPPQARTLFAPAVSAVGANDSYWMTTLWTANGPATVSYNGAGAVRLDAGEVTDDVVASRFAAAGTRGVIRAELPGGSLIGSRTFSRNGGDFVAFAGPSSATRDLIGIEVSARFRTNIGLIASESSSVRVIIHDSAGVEIARSEHLVGAGHLEQFSVVSPVTNGRARIEVLEGSVYPYGSVVDNASGDSTHLAPL
ncbi:MAG: proprotein convertase P-domain-containing protein [Thermoanaerobaculia bacterium]|nr:proprotein convertase P-domain-containing protein [Thermoanaerobaculia bacterium]